MRLVQIACLTAVLGGGAACTAMLGYDNIGFDAEASGGSTKGGAVDPLCIPGGGAAALAASCGAFVSAARGDDAGKGTPDSPYRTLAKALAQNRVVYACNDAAFDEALTIDGEVTLFGGLDCVQGWAYAPGKRTTFRAPPDQVPILLQQEATLTLRDVAVAAADASMPGGSSIALIASVDSVLDAQRCSFTAGAGRDGASPAAVIGNAKDGSPGQKGNAGCAGWTPATEPGLGGQLACDDIDVSGGGGGSGFNTGSGADGSDGLPQSGKEDGHGGKKEDANACTPGNPGTDGDIGEGGAGAQGLGDNQSKACAGGKGGDGGSGGKGGGGRGGHSIGIAHIGTLTPPAGVEIVISIPGDGGKGDGPGGDGAPGVARKIQPMD